MKHNPRQKVMSDAIAHAESVVIRKAYRYLVATGDLPSDYHYSRKQASKKWDAWDQARTVVEALKAIERNLY